MFWWIVGLEFAGAVTTYILDGFFDFGFDEMEKRYQGGEIFVSCLLWWLAIPFIMVEGLRDYGKSLRAKHEEKTKEVEKLRVAALQEVDAAMEEVEREVQQTRGGRHCC